MWQKIKKWFAESWEAMADAAEHTDDWMHGDK
jgi:hypothetical protein